jgi:hypothetical protein
VNRCCLKATNSPTPTSGRRPLSARARNAFRAQLELRKHQRTLFTAEPIELARASARAISAALFTTCRVRLEISLTLSIMMSDTNRTETSMATVKRRGRRTARQSQRSAGPKPLDPILSARLNFALSILAENGKLKGVRSERVSARVDPGLIQAARVKTGFENDSDLVNAALAVLAMPDDFGPWFVSQAGRLPKDFELEL